MPSVAHTAAFWDDELHVRCVELHTYAVGGALVTPAHRDNGSKLTLSVLLSDAGLKGGEFVTYSDGLPVAHKVRQYESTLHSLRRCAISRCSLQCPRRCNVGTGLYSCQRNCTTSAR